MASDCSRRTALKAGGAALGLAALGKALAPLAEWDADLGLEAFLQQHYHELSPADLERVLTRHEAEIRERYGVEVDITDPKPIPGTRFAYALNLSLCIGCRRCAEACHRENNHDRPSHQSYIRVFELDNGTVDLTQGTVDYDGPVPAPGKGYMPIQCHQCDHAPCVRSCPVEATWQEDDGIVVVDYDWCIGCRYCEAACPYHARRFNWRAPEITGDQINPDQAYLGNRLRPQGVMEKCHFCLHRTRHGRSPACQEECPAGARVFGDLHDPNSPLHAVLRDKRVFVLKQDLGTQPRFFYFMEA